MTQAWNGAALSKAAELIKYQLGVALVSKGLVWDPDEWSVRCDGDVAHDYKLKFEYSRVGLARAIKVFETAVKMVQQEQKSALAPAGAASPWWVPAPISYVSSSSAHPYPPTHTYSYRIPDLLS
jgi:hypothetical protein